MLHGPYNFYEHLQYKYQLNMPPNELMCRRAACLLRKDASSSWDALKFLHKMLVFQLWSNQATHSTVQFHNVVQKWPLDKTIIRNTRPLLWTLGNSSPPTLTGRRLAEWEEWDLRNAGWWSSQRAQCSGLPLSMSGEPVIRFNKEDASVRALHSQNCGLLIF